MPAAITSASEMNARTIQRGAVHSAIPAAVINSAASSSADQPDAANWQHAFFVPLIGLYYLYANREQILAAPVRSRKLGERRYGSSLRLVGWMFLFVWLLPAAVLLVLGLHRSALGVQGLAVITLAFVNTVLSLYVPSQKLGFLILLEGLAISMYGIHPGHNDFVWDFGMVVTVFGVVLMLTGYVWSMALYERRPVR